MPTTQIAIRLPDEIVAYLDRSVGEGRAPSRAALVTSALERHMRRYLAERDAEILGSSSNPDDLDELVTWSVAHPPGIED